MKLVLFLVVVFLLGVIRCQEYLDEDIEAYHFHTYFFEFNSRNLKEAIEFRCTFEFRFAISLYKNQFKIKEMEPKSRFSIWRSSLHFNLNYFKFDFVRKATRLRIENGFLPDCSLNQMMIGVDGPHPYSQWELCCNKTSFPQATAWHMQNHGNLSVLIHPLTLKDLDDHIHRAAWLGQAVPLDLECPFLHPKLETPRPCPIYPDYSDEIDITNQIGNDENLDNLDTRNPRKIAIGRPDNFVYWT